MAQPWEEDGVWGATMLNLFTSMVMLVLWLAEHAE